MSSTAASATPKSRQSALRSVEWLLVLALGTVKLWLASAWRLAAIGWAGHDDHWFLAAASSILRGKWLGDYSEMTLIKGPGYPLFVAGVSKLHLPLLFAQQLFYVLACIAVYVALRPRVPAVTARLALYIVLVFNPMTVTAEVASRIAREGIYPALTLLVVAGVAGAVVRFEEGRSAAGWSVLAGLSLAALWLTREEGVWILPFIAAGVAALVLLVARDRDARLRRAILLASMPLAIFVAAWAAVVLTNGSLYGVYATVELKQRAFLRAYGSLVSVRQHPTVSHVPVPREVRERIYAVSSAFAELRPLLEGDVGKSWTDTSREYTPGEMGGGWFVWAFRESVAKAGYYARGGQAVAEYYERIAREIETARTEGTIDARRARASMLPPVMAGERAAVLRMWLRGWLQLVTFFGISAEQKPSSGGDWDLLEMSELTRTPLAPREDDAPVMRLHVVGSVTDRVGPVRITVEQQGGGPVPGTEIVQRPAVRVKGGWRSPFEFRAAGGRSQIVLWRGGRQLGRFDLGWELPSNVPAVGLRFDEVRFESIDQSPGASDGFRFAVMQVIGRVYQLLSTVVCVAATLFYAAMLPTIVRRRELRVAALLVAGMVGSIAARLLILALIDVTSFPAMVPGYLTSAHVLLIVAVFLMTQDAFAALRLRRTSR